MKPTISRRTLLVSGGIGVGLVVGWAAWPRRYRPNLVAAPGEHVVNAFVKLGEDGHVTVVVPQAEMGQGVWTAFAQIVGDELGADWRTIAVEPAPIGPLYANELLAEEAAADLLPRALLQPGTALAREIARRESLMITGGSTSVRGFEDRLRQAGATARALLCMAAGKRWDAAWDACDTRDGFVVRGDDRLRFAELAAEAAGLTPPDDIPLRTPGQGGLSGRSQPRLDLPAKVDGSIRYAADVRLPDMLFAAWRGAPAGGATLRATDKAAAEKLPGMRAVLEQPGGVIAVATGWWTANHALDALGPRFAGGKAPDDASVDAALRAALAGPGGRFAGAGDLGPVFAGQQLFQSDYRVPFAPHAAIEPMAATARASGDRLELWLPTQAPTAARAAVARATGYAESAITVYPMPIGGGFGRGVESDAAVQAAIAAIRLKRPVQLMWSREEDLARGRHRPPALGRMSARLLADGSIAGWQAQIAAPSTGGEVARRMGLGGGEGGAEAAAVDGAIPPYAIPAYAIDHHPAEIGIETGFWRSVAHSYTAFFTESFVDELSHRAQVDPFSFRMRMLGGRARLARVLSAVAATAGWGGGGDGSGEGLALHSCFDAYVAVVAQVRAEAGAPPRVERLVAAVDCGRIVNPDIVMQQIEGGLIWGLAATLGGAVGYDAGAPRELGFDALALPRLADCPEIVVELLKSDEPPAGVGEIAVPPVAPAIANALWTVTGRRHRELPIRA